jgi:hypothetical protein
MLRALLGDHAGAQHEAVRDDFRLFGRLFEDGQEIAGQAHENSDLPGTDSRAQYRAAQSSARNGEKASPAGFNGFPVGFLSWRDKSPIFCLSRQFVLDRVRAI